MSEAKPTVFEALSAVMDDVQAVKKGDRNTQQNYNFRGIDAVVNAVGPVLRKHGVIAAPHSTEAHYRDVQTSTGKPSRECTVKVTYRFYGPAGDYLDVEVPGEAMDFGDKGAPKAMSVAYRIALLQALCIPTDDPEPDSQSYQREVDISAPKPAPRTNARDINPTTDPDPFAVDVKTDVAWLDDVRTRLDLCGSAAEVRGLWTEMVQVYGEHRLTPDDRGALERDMTARMTELKPADVSA